MGPSAARELASEVAAQRRPPDQRQLRREVGEDCECASDEGPKADDVPPAPDCHEEAAREQPDHPHAQQHEQDQRNAHGAQHVCSGLAQRVNSPCGPHDGDERNERNRYGRRQDSEADAGLQKEP